MKVIQIAVGRVTSIYLADEVAPVGGVYLPEMVRMIAERYGFPVTPPVQQPNPNGIAFLNGRMISGGKKINISSLTLYNNGVVVDTNHTDNSLSVIEDIYAWGTQAFGFRLPKNPPQKLYESNIIVDFDTPIQLMLKTFGKISKITNAALKKTYQKDFSTDFSVLGINADPTNLPSGWNPALKIDFSIGRRIGVPYSENRYFCMAPLQTEEHISWIHDFEKSICS